LLIAGGAVIWSGRGEDNPTVPAQADGPDHYVSGLARILPAPPVDGFGAATGPALHTVAYTVENGTRVVKIKVVETGDELVVDAITGRFIEARPGRPTAPPPRGKFAAPFHPIT
jgi:hypothetical protein